jgi:hypothetical protein
MPEDRTLTCVECGLKFIFSVDEQRVHASRGYGHEPRRCPPCRVDARSRRRAQEQDAAKAGSPRRSQAENPAEAGRPGNPPGPGHITLCASCGVEVFLQAPPAPGVPVLCDNCRPNRSS